MSDWAWTTKHLQLPIFSSSDTKVIVDHSEEVFVKMQRNAMVTLQGVTQETTVAMETASQGRAQREEAGRSACAPSFHPRCSHPVTAHILSNTNYSHVKHFMSLCCLLWTEFCNHIRFLAKGFNDILSRITSFPFLLNIDYIGSSE